MYGVQSVGCFIECQILSKFLTLKMISSSMQHLAPKLAPYSLHLLVDSMAPKFSIQLKDVNKSMAFTSRVLRGFRELESWS